MSTIASRQLFAGLALLDRQLVDREGSLCGKVDDLEISPTGDDGWFVSALVCGPGALLRRLGFAQLGPWMERFATGSSATGTMSRVPFRHVADIDSHVSLSLYRTELRTWSMDRWFDDHVIRHIPGNGGRAQHELRDADGPRDTWAQDDEHERAPHDHRRLSQLLGCRVTTSDGVDLGRVHDVRLQQDGPHADGLDATFRIIGLAVGRGSIAERFGYLRTEVEGPALLRWLACRIERKGHYVDWSTAQAWDPSRRHVVLGTTARQVPSIAEADLSGR